MIVATGGVPRRLGVDNEERFIGRGISFCATCDGPFYRGEDVAVVGGGNSAAEESLFLASLARHVTLLVRDDHLNASQVIQDNLRRRDNIDIRFNTEVVRFDGAHNRDLVNVPEAEVPLEVLGFFQEGETLPNRATWRETVRDVCLGFCGAPID